MTSEKRWCWHSVLTGSVLLVGSLVSACVATVEPHPPVHLEMAGASSMQSVMEELADAYTRRSEHVTIDVEARGSRLGLEALRDGAVDLALVSRELSPSEEQGLEATVVAHDAIAILVNNQNTVDSLSSQQLREVFSGDILVWSEVGGEEVDIQVLSREDGSGTREWFEEMVMEGRRVTLTAIVMPSNQAVGRHVAEKPLAIGYASAADVAVGAKPLRIDGVKPDLQAVTQGDYPLGRPFMLVTRRSPDEEVQAFVHFVVSPAGQVIVGQRYRRAR